MIKVDEVPMLTIVRSERPKAQGDFVLLEPCWQHFTSEDFHSYMFLGFYKGARL
jgi:hypothetical protein